MEYKLIKPLVISVFISLAAYIVFIALIGYKEVAETTSLVNLNVWLIILGLSIVNFLLRFIRWQYYLVKLGHQIKLFPSLTYYLAGFALTMTPGKVGETIRSIYLKTHGISYTGSFAGFFVERYTDLIAIISLSVLVLSYYSGQKFSLILILIFLIGVFLIVNSSWLPAIVDHLSSKTKHEKIKLVLLKLSNVLKASSSLLLPIPLLTGILIALVAWAIQGLVLYVILSHMNLPITISFAIGCYALSMLAGAVSFIPGGLGSTEAVMILLLLSIGSSPSDATAATLLTRVATLWFAMTIGLLALMYAETSTRRNKHLN